MGEVNTNKLGDPDQIPQEHDSQGKTGSVISEQGGIPGQKKEVNVESYSKVATVGQLLKDLDFPADKNKILSFARQQSSTPDGKNIKHKEEILSDLEKLEERKYENVSEITTTLGMVY